MKFMASLGFIPLNSSTAFTSICANILLFPNNLLALSSYCAFMSVAFTAFSNSNPNFTAPLCLLHKIYLHYTPSLGVLQYSSDIRYRCFPLNNGFNLFYVFVCSHNCLFYYKTLIVHIVKSAVRSCDINALGILCFPNI